MNNILKHFALTMLVALLSSLSASAYDFKVDGIYYDKLSDGKSVEVTYRAQGNISYSGDIVIPSTVTYYGTTYSVTSIGESAFGGCSNLTSVEIPNSVTSIGQFAFSGCSSLTSVVIPNSVTEIGDFAFDCSSLARVIIMPSSISSDSFVFGIGASTSGCVTYVKNSSIPGAGTKIVYSQIFTVGDMTFMVTDLGNKTCDLISYDGNEANVTVPDKVLFNDKFEFSVNNVGQSTFHSNSTVESITFNNSGSINTYACYNCPKLTSLYIGENVTQVLGYMLDGSTRSLKAVEVAEDNAALCSIDGVICNKAKTQIILAPRGITEFTIPATVTSIADNAFRYCSNLTTMTIPQTVSSIGTYAFADCGFTSLNINMTGKISDYAFQNAAKLQDLRIPHSVTAIGQNAFDGCAALKTIYLGEKLQSIGYQAFLNCTKVTSITSTNLVPPTCESEAFSDMDHMYCEVNVRPEALEAYQSATGWSDFWMLQGYNINYISKQPTTDDVSIAMYDPEEEVTFQWYDADNETPITGATTSVLNISMLANVDRVYCEVTLSDGVKLKSDIVEVDTEDVPTYTTNIYNGTSGSTPQALTVAQIQALETGNNSLVFVNANLATEFDANIVKKNGSGNWVASEIKLVDAQPFYCPSDVTAGEISYTRTFTTDCWQPLYLPFEVKNDAAVQAIGKVAYINNVHQYDTALDGSGETIIEYLSVPDGATLLANRMYVIKPNAEVLDKEVAFTAEDETLKATTSANIACSSTTHRYTFTGIYQPKTDMASTGAYALTAEGFNRAANDAQTLSPFRFFLTVTNIDNAYGNAAPAAAPSRIRIMVDGVIDGEATGIDAAHTETIKRESGSYNLAGQKVGEGYRGIVIKNGKKIRL